MSKPLGMVCVLLALAACAPSTAEQTMIAQNAAWGTQIVDFRTTATVGADRMMITLEAAQTQVSQANNQNAALMATLSARGADPTLLAMFTPQPGLAFGPQPTAAGNGLAPTTSGATLIVPTSQGAREQTATETPAAPQATAFVSAPNGTALIGAVMSSGVGSDDCEIDQRIQFSAADAEIYVVARTQGIRAGMVLLSRWLYEGSEQITHDFTPSSDILDNRCVWFFIDQTELAFTPGSWTVQLEVDGAVVGSAAFVIAP